MQKIKNIVPILLILCLSYFAIKPLLSPGFFSMHDDTQVARVFEMHQALADGAFPVRWIGGLGYNYGYPLFNFYAPLAYYIGGFFAFFTDPLVATKLMMMLGIVLSGVGMYLFAKEFWGKLGGIISGLLYVYGPYHAVNIYVRGDVPEFWAYAFIPFAFFGIYKVYTQCVQSIASEVTTKTQKKKIFFSVFTTKTWLWVSFAAFSYAGIILSHNLSAMMVTPFLFIFALILALQRKQKKRFLIFIPFVLGLLLSAFYWLPVPAELHYTNVLSQVGGTADFKDHFVCVQQLWESPWGYGGSTHDCMDGFSFRIGKIHILLAFFACISLFFLWKSKRTNFTLVLFSCVSVCLLVFLMLQQSQVIWDTVTPMAFFQYPWRLLLLVSFFVSFLGGASVFVLSRFFKDKIVLFLWVITVGIGVVIIYHNAKVFVPQTQVQKTAADYTQGNAISWSASKLSDEYLPKGFHEPKRSSEIPSHKITSAENIKVLSLQETTQGLNATVDAKKQTRLLLSYAYFPGLRTYIDKKEVGFTYSERGIYVTVPKGKHRVDVRFVQTPIEIAGNIASLTGVLLIIIGIISTRRTRNNGKKSN
jgi:hypothetical protein